MTYIFNDCLDIYKRYEKYLDDRENFTENDNKCKMAILGNIGGLYRDQFKNGS